MNDWVQIGRQYAQDVMSGEIPACRWIKLAAEASERDFKTFARNDSVYYFDEESANDACDFLSTLRHVDDGVFTKAGDPFEPLPWQVWATIHIFGWRWRDTGSRRYRRAFFLVARGNGKSTWAAGLMLYALFCENIQGGQGCCAASNKDQARLVLDVARRMAQQDKELREGLKLRVFADDVKQPPSGSRLWALPAKASSAEGLALNVGVLDEVLWPAGARCSIRWPRVVANARIRCSSW